MWSSRKPEPDVAHLLPVAVAIVRQHVDDDDAAAGLEHARHLGRARAPAPARGAAPASASPRRAARRRSAALRARRGAGRRCRSRCSRFCAACSIAADASTAMTRATNGASAALTWPVPQPRSPTVQSASAKRRERRQVKAIAEQLVAQPIPLAGRRGEELLRLRPPLGERRLQAALILRGRGRRADLLPHEQPEAAGAPASRSVARSSCRSGSCPRRARAIQPPSSQRLQVPADGRLRQLHDAAELGHRQLVPVEQQQHAAPRRVGERGEMVEDGGGARPFIRYNRIKGYTKSPRPGQCRRRAAARCRRLTLRIGQMSMPRRFGLRRRSTRNGPLAPLLARGRLGARALGAGDRVERAARQVLAGEVLDEDRQRARLAERRIRLHAAGWSTDGKHHALHLSRGKAAGRRRPAPEVERRDELLRAGSAPGPRRGTSGRS